MGKKVFFQNEDDDLAYPKSYFINVLKETGEKEMKVFAAVIEYGTEYFFCSEFLEVGIKEESGCGTLCGFYSPRNGKNGRCKHSQNCYTHGEEVIIKNPSPQ